MNINRLIDLALTPPPPELLDICGDYYQPYYHFFLMAARQLGRGWLVELGIEQGRSLAALAMSGLQVIGVDHIYHPGLDAVLKRFDNIIFLQQSSLPPPKLFEPQSISLLHIDTEHSYAMARAEFEAYRPYLTRPAVVVFDDLHAQDNDVLAYFKSLDYPQFQDDRLHPVSGWGAILYT